MSTFTNLARHTPTKESFLARILRKSNKPKSVSHAEISLVHFENFCKKIYKKDSYTVIKELSKVVKKNPVELYEFLDSFVAFLVEIKKEDKKTNQRTGDAIAPVTVRGYFADLKGYLRHHSISIDNDMLRQHVILPKILKEEDKPIVLEDIQKLIEKADDVRTALYLVLTSSGMRLGESIQLRKHHFDLNQNPVKITIPANIAKNSKGRSTFISNEATEKVKPLLEKIDHDDLVFTKSSDSERAGLTEENYFARLRVKCNLLEKQTNGRKFRVHIHKFRGWFTTTATNAGMSQPHVDSITGWSSFKSTYHKYESSKLAEEYSKIEPSILISPEWRAVHEIKEKDEKLTQIRHQDKRISELESNIDDLKYQLICNIQKDVPRIPKNQLDLIDILKYNDAMVESHQLDKIIKLSSTQLTSKYIDVLKHHKSARADIKKGIKEGKFTKKIYELNENIIVQIQDSLKKIP